MATQTAVSTALIEVEHLSFWYRRTPVAALQDISLAIYPGEVLLIAGPSGCGKSTLLRCLNGLIPHTYRGEQQGVVRIAGRDTRELTLAGIAETVGTVLQDPERQIVAANVLEEVAFGLENQGLPVAEVLERSYATLEELSLAAFAEREMFTLSGGEKQKLALAGVLALKPQVIILDEPLANLDPQSAAESMALCAVSPIAAALWGSSSIVSRRCSASRPSASRGWTRAAGFTLAPATLLVSTPTHVQSSCPHLSRYGGCKRWGWPHHLPLAGRLLSAARSSSCVMCASATTSDQFLRMSARACTQATASRCSARTAAARAR
ncbi:ABC transporter ATP-binding protein [Candidatus Gracilibacteria bacterium]|nr:ABC transporter ATP-binding protein [Candidatus Gracilibacteria bacterium]